MEMFRLPRLRLKRCLSKWWRLNWKRGKMKVYIMETLKAKLTSLGKFKPVIKKAMVELDGAPFKKFASMGEEWAIKSCYIGPACFRQVEFGAVYDFSRRACSHLRLLSPL